jgi:large subunit ribosomal protein L24
LKELIMARHIKVGDMVEVISGAGAGKQGKPGVIGRVLRILPDKNRVVVEGVNRVWKHVRPSQRNPQGGRIQKDAPIHISNVLPVDPSTNRGTRVKFETREGKKVRVAKGGTVLSTLAKAE